MEANNLSLEEINPKEAELRQLAADFAALTINGTSDKEGYDRVHAARMVLKGKRVDVEKDGKTLREKTTAFNKAVIARVNELIGIIEPLEDRLHAMEKEIDQAVEMEKRRALLPIRREKITAIEGVLSDEEVLSMSPEQFDAWHNENRARFLDRKEAALKAEAEKVEAAKRAEQEAAEREEVARKQVEAVEALEATIKAQREADEARHAIELEKAKSEAQEAERLRIEREAAAKAEADAKAQADLESRKKYQNWLKGNQALTPDGKLAEGFVVKQDGKKLELYKCVDTITL